MIEATFAELESLYLRLNKAALKKLSIEVYRQDGHINYAVICGNHGHAAPSLEAALAGAIEAYRKDYHCEVVKLQTRLKELQGK